MNLYIEKRGYGNVFYATNLPHDITPAVSIFNSDEYRFKDAGLKLAFVEDSEYCSPVYRKDLHDFFLAMHQGQREFWLPYREISLEPNSIPFIQVEEPVVYQAKLEGMYKPVYASSIRDCIRKIFEECEECDDENVAKESRIADLIAGLYSGRNPFTKLALLEPKEEPVEEEHLKLVMSHILRSLGLGKFWCKVFRDPRDTVLSRSRLWLWIKVLTPDQPDSDEKKPCS